MTIYMYTLFCSSAMECLGSTSFSTVQRPSPACMIRVVSCLQAVLVRQLPWEVRKTDPGWKTHRCTERHTERHIYIYYMFFYICSACFSPLVVPNLLLYIVMRGWLVARLLSCSSSKSTTASCLCGVPLLDIRRIDIGRRSTLFPCASEAGDHHPRVVIQD